jgi:FkbM family methyltransferase
VLTDRLYRLSRVWPTAHCLFRRAVHRLPHRTRRVRHFGRELLVDPSELHGFYLYYEQEYDDPIFHFLLERLPSFRWAIDLGANIGIYTTFLALHCEQVDAFEPEKQVLPRLQENLSLNGIRNVTIHEKCVSDVSGEVLFVPPSRQNQGVGRVGEGGVPVDSITLDVFLAEPEQRPLFIKMDIEGGEWLAVRGAQQAFRSWEPPLSILIELHPDEISKLGGTLPDLQRLLEGSGLTVQSLDSGELRPVSQSSRFWWVTNG